MFFNFPRTYNADEPTHDGIHSPNSKGQNLLGMSLGARDEVHDYERRPLIFHAPRSCTPSEYSPKEPLSIMSPGALGAAETPLEEARQKNVTEYDLAAYYKDEFTCSMEKNIMRRVFNVFDVQQSGSITISGLSELCNYLGYPLIPPDEEEEARLRGETAVVKEHPKYTEGNRVTFENFWVWWLNRRVTQKGAEAFALVSAQFSLPFHQQQLMLEEIGEKFTLNYRIKYYFKDLETTRIKPVSPWHDIPLFVRDIVRTISPDVVENRYNFICEIPKWTRAKFEINTREPYNPIRQDIKNGVPRFYKHGDMMWNYGAFPQTWESTEVEDNGVFGDNDPLDAIEIGMTQLKTGSVTPVKVLGALGMIDDGLMDWKVVTISIVDPIAPFLEDITDVPKYIPGCLDAFREWMRVYKICQGGVENQFAFNGEFKNRDFTIKLLDNSHLMWGNLLKVHKKEYFGDKKEEPQE